MGVVQTTEGTWISKERTCVDEDHIYIYMCVYIGQTSTHLYSVNKINFKTI